jgi:hypothetical protein
MIVSEQQLLVRYFKLGAVLALAGSIHILTLLLPWYVVKSDTVSTTILTGYILPVTLLLSVAGGVLAGISLLATSFSTKVNVVRLSLTSLALAGGLLALLSPLYMAFISIPNLGVGGAPDIGFYGATLSAVVVIGLGVLAIVTKPKRVEVPYTGYQASWSASETPVEETSMVVPDSVDEGVVCPICYTSVTVENALKCSSCGVVFHAGCVETYVNINGTCPNCNRAVVG